jgi:hypothetical protein
VVFRRVGGWGHFGRLWRCGQWGLAATGLLWQKPSFARAGGPVASCSCLRIGACPSWQRTVPCSMAAPASLSSGSGGDAKGGGHFLAASSERLLGISQRRYSDYFLAVLSAPQLAQPSQLPKLLKQVPPALSWIPTMIILGASRPTGLSRLSSYLSIAS